MSENWAYRIVVLIVLGLLALEASVSATSDPDVSKVVLKTKPSTSVNTTSIHGNVTSAEVRGLEEEGSSSLMEDAEEDVMARQIVNPSVVPVQPPQQCRRTCQQRCVPQNGVNLCRNVCHNRCIVGDEEQNSTTSNTTATTKLASASGTTEKPDTETDNTEEGSGGPDSGEEGTDESDATTPKPQKKVKTVRKKPTSGLGLSEIPDQPTIVPVPVGLPVASAVLPIPFPLAAYGRPFLDRFHPFSYDPFRFRPYRHRRRFPFRFFDESADDETPESESVLIIADEE